MKSKRTIRYFVWIVCMQLLIFCNDRTFARSEFPNPYARNIILLNGDWNVLVDPTGIGDWRQVWLEKKPEKQTDFFEYSFDGSPLLKVPGDFNSQLCELSFYEGLVWYRKHFNYSLPEGKRLFVCFDAVNYLADVYLNGVKLGSHEGGFTPFQFEITDEIRKGLNSLIVRVENKRHSNGLPGNGYDWMNFGGITRDVYIRETPLSYISDYTVQLKKASLNQVLGWVKMEGNDREQEITVEIPELNINYKSRSDKDGHARIEFSADFELWSPENPKLYKVIISSETDSVSDLIGFRCIEIQGNQVLLNKKPVFLKAVNIHEENPYTASRASSVQDAHILLNAAKELGCNMVRLVHYPHSGHMVREAEKMGLMIWDELPVYQHIEFSDVHVPLLLDQMLREMIKRDKNRCGVIIWSLSNETYSSTPGRDRELVKLTAACRALDSTRIVTHVISSQGYEKNTFNVWDSLYRHSDLIAINEYAGWYVPWQGKPTEAKWKVIDPNKPVFISEFGGEALYGNKGHADEAAFWSEDYQENIYKNQVEMFKNVPNLCGVCPWLLFDYKSPGRMHPVYQKGYNRKGLLSEKGQKKKAWYVMKDYYNTH